MHDESRPDQTPPEHKDGSASASPDADRLQEEAVKDSFPASDPPASTGIVGPGGDKPKEGGKRPA